MPGMVDRMTKEGDDYSQARQAFNVLLANYGRAMHFASRFVGGLDVSRSHKGDKDAPTPFQVIEPAKQREALQLLKEHVFSDKPYEVDPQLYNLLAPSRWNHWGMPTMLRSDFRGPRRDSDVAEPHPGATLVVADTRTIARCRTEDPVRSRSLHDGRTD